MIVSFKKNNIAQEIFLSPENSKPSKKLAKEFAVDYVKKAKSRLVALHNALSPSHLHNNPPGGRLKKIHHGKYKGYYSMRIEGQWRICFRWGVEWGLDANAYEVEINKHYGDKNT